MTLIVKRNRIWVTFQKEGIHKYPAALEDPKLKTTAENFRPDFMSRSWDDLFTFLRS